MRGSEVCSANILARIYLAATKPIDEADVIIGMSTIEGIGSGFRERLFTPRWNFLQAQMLPVKFDAIPALDVRMVIDNVEPKRTIIGIEGPSFVVETHIPIREFKQLSIGEKNDRVLDTIFESIKAAYAHFGDQAPPEIDLIWEKARTIGRGEQK